MRRIAVFYSVILLTALFVPVAAQEPDGPLGQVFFVRPTPASVPEFEESLKKHMQWHQKNDDWAWLVWEIASGDRTGTYAIGSFGHAWADLDERSEAGGEDRADWFAGGGPSNVADQTVEFWSSQSELSRPPEEGGAPPSGVAYYTHLNPGMTGAYLGAAQKIQTAIEKADLPVHYFRAALVASGESNTSIRWAVRENWAAFGQTPQTSFPEMLEATHGRQEAQSILDTLAAATHCQRSEIWTFRQDLTFLPQP